MSDASKRRSILFVSPVEPRPKGNGRAMRAWHTVNALARDADVHLWVAERGRGTGPDIPRLPVASLGGLYVPLWMYPVMWARRMALRVGLLSVPADWLLATPRVRRSLEQFMTGKRVDGIHVFRLYLFPAVQCVAGLCGRVPVELDLDDIESETRLRIAALYRRGGYGLAAAGLERESKFLGLREKEILPECRSVWVCSSIDRDKLAARGPGLRVAVVPNSVSPPAGPLPPPPKEGPFTFLFVGTLNYYPNRDAVEFLCREVVPLLRQRTGRSFRIRVVGRVPGLLAARIRKDVPEVDIPGPTEDMAPHYAASHAVVVPLRAGGGTRVKIIEAFAYGRPVVATPMAVEGLEAEHDVHVLLADTTEGLASHCVRLMGDPSLAARLSREAMRLYAARYHPDVVATAVLATQGK